MPSREECIKIIKTIPWNSEVKFPLSADMKALDEDTTKDYNSKKESSQKISDTLKNIGYKTTEDRVTELNKGRKSKNQDETASDEDEREFPLSKKQRAANDQSKETKRKTPDETNDEQSQINTKKKKSE